jgi:hypothetical protein
VKTASEAVDQSCIQIKNLECELQRAHSNCKSVTVKISALEESSAHRKDVITSLSQQLVARDTELARTVSDKERKRWRRCYMRKVISKH